MQHVGARGFCLSFTMTVSFLLGMQPQEWAHELKYFNESNLTHQTLSNKEQPTTIPQVLRKLYNPQSVISENTSLIAPIDLENQDLVLEVAKKNDCCCCTGCSVCSDGCGKETLNTLGVFWALACRNILGVPSETAKFVDPGVNVLALLCQIWRLGSHQSGQAEFYGYRWGFQTGSITQQLEDGVRCLDIRPVRIGDTLYHVHGDANACYQMLWKSGGFTKVEDLLREVADFAKKNPKAIILITLSSYNDPQGSSSLLDDIIKRTLSSAKIVPDQTVSSTVKEALERGWQFIIFDNNGSPFGQPQNLRNNYPWNPGELSDNQFFWTGYGSEASVCYNPKRLLTVMDPGLPMKDDEYGAKYLASLTLGDPYAGQRNSEKGIIAFIQNIFSQGVLDDRPFGTGSFFYKREKNDPIRGVTLNSDHVTRHLENGNREGTLIKFINECNEKIIKKYSQK